MKERESKRVVVIVVWQMMLAASPLGSVASPPAVRIAKPGCQDRCGDIRIPYPFGIGPGCYHNQWFEVQCIHDDLYMSNKVLHAGRPYIGKEATHIGQLNCEGQDQTLTIPAYIMGFKTTLGDSDQGSGYANRLSQLHDLEGSPYLFSSTNNVLVINGCAGAITMVDRKNKTLAGCASICINIDSMPTQVDDCFGIGCCQAAPISPSFDYYKFKYSVLGVKNTTLSNRINLAIFMGRNWMMNNSRNLSTNMMKDAQVVLEWIIKDMPINSTYANSTCKIRNDNEGLVCNCKEKFYEGNPYLPYGCQVVKECESCVQECTVLPNTNSFGCPQNGEPSTLLLVFGLSVGYGLLLPLLGVYWLYQTIKRKRTLERKAKNFERNGGLLLKQKMSNEHNITDETFKMFSSEELDKATDHYNEDRVLGQGGQGTVYKGMLSDGEIVAIKKSKIVGESQLNVFINEVLILSQINHRNVVRLLGCCLEAEVPMLVYEYVHNGTLSENINGSKEDFPITWEMRLHIATDIANAIAYLHSSYLIPIFHRDIKSSNILLDTKYRAKLSDFGMSKSLSLDQTHITTRVIGTFGYLDPEYFYSQQFTDKSDVYSFGVVLVELLSGQEATKVTEVDQRGLVAWFLDHINESNLYDILDARVIREGREEEIMAVAHLAKRCINLDGKRRPTMKEVAAELETIRSSLQPELASRNPSIKSNESGESSSWSSIDITMEDETVGQFSAE